MDFGRGVKKRARMMDKKLDQIVANPYEGQAKRSHNSIKKPLFISFGAAAACLCVVFASIGIVKVIDNMSSNRGSGIIIDPDYKPEDKDKTKPGYKGTVPKIDLKNYVSNNFGYPEFSYFSFFANSVSMPRMAVRGTDLEDIGETKEYTTYEPMNSYTDGDGNIHTPLPILPTYSFSDFLYFEFDSPDSSFLADKIGNGHIQALYVHTNVSENDVLVLKQSNKFYLCFSDDISCGDDGKIQSISFDAGTYIDGWDIVRNPNETTNITVMIGHGKDLENATAVIINKNMYYINSKSTYYLKYSFDISVNKVRKFIGLDADPKFEITEPIDSSIPQEIYFKDKTTFILQEHGNDTFDFQGVTNAGEPIYRFGSKIFSLEGYYWKDSYFVFDVNGDGYRDFIYCGKNEAGCYHALVYDLHNDILMYEKVHDRTYFLWYEIKNNTLLAILCDSFNVNNGAHIYDHGDIVWYEPDIITLEWYRKISS